MAALDLHHAIFTNEKASDLPLRSAASFLHPAPERDASPTSHLFASAAYQDLIQRQPTHPDGPMSGWDLGLNLLGDPMTTAEHKSLEDYRTRVKLRRLHAANVAFELLFGTWGTYTTVRYFLAFVDDSDHTEHLCALVLGVISALVVALVIISISMPLFPQQSDPRAWRHARALLRACYLLLLSACAVMNLILVLMWQPKQSCGWDIDISWNTSAANTVTSPCHPASSAAWVVAAILRLVATWATTLSFVYTLRSYHKTRHHSPEYSPYLPSDAEDNTSPVSMSSPLHRLRSTLKFARSVDSDHTLNQSNTTLPKSNSISTLTPSTSCTGHSRCQSTPPRDMSTLKISPPTTRGTSTHMTNHEPSTQFRSETPSRAQPVNTVTEPLSASHMLRRTSRIISVAKVTSDATLSEMSSHLLERCDGQTEIRSSPASWRPGHRGTSVHPDHRKPSLAWEMHVSQASAGSALFSSTHDKNEADDDPVYSYGYGARGPTYPYLDMYNPQIYAETSSCTYEDANAHGIPQGHRVGRAIPCPDASSESSSPTREEEEDVEEEKSSSGEGEEYVAMMGGFVRRMATIESLGSKEAAGTTTTTTTTTTRHSSVRSKTSASQFSSVRFAAYGSSCTPSVVTPLSGSCREGSFSTAYFSLSSRGTGMRVDERGELLPGFSANRSTAGSPYDRQYYTASGSSDEGR